MKHFEKTKKITAADILLLALVFMCILGICVRIFIAKDGLFNNAEEGEYFVRFVVTGEKSEHGDYYSDGKVFYTEDDSPFGTLTGSYRSTPSKQYFENKNGEYEFMYSSDGKVDISATMLVTGTMTDGGFLLNGSKYIAANTELSVHSSDITVTVLITDITKAS